MLRDRQRELQDLTKTRPEKFLRYTYPNLLEKSRNAVACHGRDNLCSKCNQAIV
jgi:hypothetical protein